MDPFTLLVLGGIALVVWLRRPSSTLGPLFPTPGDLLMVKIDRPGAENPAYSLSPQLTNEIVNAFAARGYRVMPVANEGGPTGARNSYLRGFGVTGGAANVELPPAIGPGLTIVAQRKAPSIAAQQAAVNASMPAPVATRGPVGPMGPVEQAMAAARAAQGRP